MFDIYRERLDNTFKVVRAGLARGMSKEEILQWVKDFNEDKLKKYWEESNDPEIHQWRLFKKVLNITGISICIFIALYCVRI